MNDSILCARLGFAFQSRRTYLVALGILVVMVLFDRLMGGKLLTAPDSIWNGFLNAVVGLGTLFTAFAVWWEEVGQDWRSSLTRRLSVKFVYQGRLVMYCQEAHLANEGDIRALSQQIGAQIAEIRQLDLKIPSVEFSTGEVTRSMSGEFQLHYTAKFELTNLPDKLKALGNDEYYSWTPPFDLPEKLSFRPD